MDEHGEGPSGTVAVNLTALIAEVRARGFNDSSAWPDARITAWLNAAYQLDICEDADWLFLRASAAGTAPLTVEDLRTVESVVDSTNRNKLRPANRRDLTEMDPTLVTSATPEFYYFSSQTQVSVYPANATVTLEVRYWRSPAALASGTDSPVVPDRFHLAIVDYAVARASADSNQYDQVEAARSEGDRAVALMRATLLDPQADRPSEEVFITDPDAL